MPWLLNFTDPNFNAPAGNGRPWADGTEMALRAQPGAANPNPWDDNCLVTTYVDGLTAMSAMRNDLEAVTAAANAPGAPPVGQRGHVYIADWRFNGLRDLSTHNPWAMDAWAPGQVANPDQTAIGLVVRLLQAGVRVRIMLWLPTAVQAQFVGNAHVQDHYWAAKVVRDESNRIAPALNPPLGVVALDMRTAGISPPRDCSRPRWGCPSSLTSPPPGTTRAVRSSSARPPPTTGARSSRCPSRRRCRRLGPGRAGSRCGGRYRCGLGRTRPCSPG
ncbi:MAG: hypothetical protein M3Z75_12090 [Actinomycetota bacterium]|nr:hypothetical protein [Actinomycetota bacterium]